MMDIKKQTQETFHKYVSPYKADFYKRYGLDFVMGKRDGCYLWDIQGEKRLFNCHCNGGVFNLGHRNKEIIASLTTAINEYDIGNHHFISTQRAKLAKRLAESMPGDIRYTIFGVSGGEAVDLAIKLARGYTGKTKIISAMGGYHGHTGLALAAGDEKYRTPFGIKFHEFVQIPFGDLQTLEKELEGAAAVIYETIPATLGIVIPANDFFRTVRRLCNKYGVQLIMDEVQTGFGRTGKLWGYEHFLTGSENLTPDIVVIGKGMSGGVYPITGTCFRPHLQTVFKDDPFIHISTFGGAELGCVVAGKVLDITVTPEFLEHVNILSEKFRENMTQLKKNHKEFILEFRQLGLMMGIKMKNKMCGPLLTKTAYDNDLLMIYANNDTSVCQFIPPLIMSLRQVEEVFEKLNRAIVKAKMLLPVIQVKKGMNLAWKKVKKSFS